MRGLSSLEGSGFPGARSGDCWELRERYPLQPGHRAHTAQITTAKAECTVHVAVLCFSSCGTALCLYMLPVPLLQAGCVDCCFHPAWSSLLSPHLMVGVDA